MSHPLQQKIGSLRRRLRWLLVLYGLGWIVAAVVAAVVVLGGADYVLRFQDRGIRVIFSLVVLGVLGWTCYRFLFRGLSARLRDVELAIRLQRRFPALGDSLASAVEFLKQSEDDPTAGSVSLRRAVIAQTTAETDVLDFSDVLEQGPALRVGLSAIAICLVAAILLVFGWPDSRTAVARLVNPLGKFAYLQKTHLALREPVPRVVARGQAFEVEAVDAQGAKLPAEVRIQYRFEGPDGSPKEETERMHFLGDAMTARRENVSRPFSFRVEGGDDSSMDWVPVEVLEPPGIDSILVKLIPPAYTGLPAETAERLIRALAGTRVQIAGRATKPLESAALCLDGGRQVPVQLGGDGLELSVSGDGESGFVIDKSGSCWFRLTDREGLTGDGGVRWEIRAVPDSPPSVTIEQPTATVYVTPQAVVPVRVVVKDDLAVRRVELVAVRPDQPDAEPWVFLLYKGPEKVPPQTAGFSSGAELGENRPPIPYRWDLAGMKLRPGTQVTFHATAADYRPQTGQSEPRRLAIITPEELADRIAARQSVILAELARVLQIERDSRREVGAQEEQVRLVGSLDQGRIDRLGGAELKQRQVNRSLTSRSEGVPVHVLGLLADLENNKIDSPDVRRRMEGILAEIERLAAEHLPVIGRELTAAIKAAQIRLQEQPAAGPAGAEDAIAGSLATAGRDQDRVIESLEQMLGRLAQWESYRRFHRDVGQLLREQEELARRSAELARDTLTKEFQDLLPQQQADLSVLARQQRELARRLDRIQQEMEQAAGRLHQSDPLAAETVSDALFRACQLAISGAMQATGNHLADNRMGQALARQKQIAENLQEILDILANRRESELLRLVKKLREAEAELADLAGQQEGLCKQIEAAATRADQQQRRRELEKLSRDQAKLEKQAGHLARRLQRLLADRAGETTGEAAEKMGHAGRQAKQGSGREAAQQAAEARKDLEKARKQLAQRRLQAQVELATEQLARLEDALKNVHGRQKNVLDETGRLDDLQRAPGGLTPGQDVTLTDLARQQRLLRTETAALVEKMAGAKVFTLALSGAVADMTRAADLLARRQTGPPAQQVEQSALRRLAQLLEALKSEEPQGDTSSGSAGGPGGQQGGSPGGIQLLAELKLLKLMQGEINRQTGELEQSFGGVDKLDEAARAEYELLSREQGRLADLLLEMIQVQGDPEDNPDRLPDVPPEERRDENRDEKRNGNENKKP